MKRKNKFFEKLINNVYYPALISNVLILYDEKVSKQITNEGTKILNNLKNKFNEL